MMALLRSASMATPNLVATILVRGSRGTVGIRAAEKLISLLCMAGHQPNSKGSIYPL